MTRLTAALEQARREADAAGQARAEADDLSTQVWHSQLSAALLSPSGSCGSVQRTPEKGSSLPSHVDLLRETRLCSVSQRFRFAVSLRADQEVC